MNPAGAGLVALLYGVLPGLQTWVYIAAQPFADLTDTANFAASIVSYHWLLANVLMSLKLPMLQNSLPYDLRVRLHIWSTLGLTAFLTWHSVYTIALKAKEIDLVSWTLLGLFGGLVLLSLLWIPLPGLKALRRTLVDGLRFGFLKSFDWMKASHKALFLVLAGLTYVHIVQARLVGLVPEPSAWAYEGLFWITAAAFFATRLHNLTLPSLKVRSVVNEGGIVRLSLDPHPRLAYEAGQFAFLRFDAPSLRGQEHPFSFTTIRGEGRVGFAVRALGDFTSQLTRLGAGDTVRINGGFGSFRPRTGTGPLALIGSGIGAAPLVSILKEVARLTPGREVVCLLSVTRRNELVEAEALEVLAQSMPNLRLRLLATEDGAPPYGPEILARELPGPDRYEYYLCSSPTVRSVVVKSLRGLGIAGRKLHFESFNLG